MIAHYVDRATRFHTGCIVPDKTEDTLWYAFRDRWLTILGTPETVVTDGEAALVTTKNRARFAAHNIHLSVRAPGQHAHFAERHGAMLRHTVHVLAEQLKAENLTEPLSSILPEAFFALNALTQVGGSTPYQAVLGRQPGCLPPILDGHPVGAGDSVDGRREQRIREVALQGMIQASAPDIQSQLRQETLRSS